MVLKGFNASDLNQLFRVCSKKCPFVHTAREVWIFGCPEMLHQLHKPDHRSDNSSHSAKVQSALERPTATHEKITTTLIDTLRTMELMMAETMKGTRRSHLHEMKFYDADSEVMDDGEPASPKEEDITDEKWAPAKVSWKQSQGETRMLGPIGV